MRTSLTTWRTFARCLFDRTRLLPILSRGYLWQFHSGRKRSQCHCRSQFFYNTRQTHRKSGSPRSGTKLLPTSPPSLTEKQQRHCCLPLRSSCLAHGKLTLKFFAAALSLF